MIKSPIALLGSIFLAMQICWAEINEPQRQILKIKTSSALFVSVIDKQEPLVAYPIIAQLVGKTGEDKGGTTISFVFDKENHTVSYQVSTPTDQNVWDKVMINISEVRNGVLGKKSFLASDPPIWDFNQNEKIRILLIPLVSDAEIDRFYLSFSFADEPNTIQNFYEIPDGYVFWDWTWLPIPDL